VCVCTRDRVSGRWLTVKYIREHVYAFTRARATERRIVEAVIIINIIIQLKRIRLPNGIFIMANVIRSSIGGPARARSMGRCKSRGERKIQ